MRAFAAPQRHAARTTSLLVCDARKFARVGANACLPLRLPPFPRRHAQLLLSALANVVFLGLLGWQASFSSAVSTGGGSRSSRREHEGEGTRGNVATRGSSCPPPRLNQSLLEAWGCKVLSDACFDQVGADPCQPAPRRCIAPPPRPAVDPGPQPPLAQERVVLHSGECTPSDPRFVAGRIFQQQGTPAFILPGYSEPLGGWLARLAAHGTCLCCCRPLAHRKSSVCRAVLLFRLPAGEREELACAECLQAAREHGQSAVGRRSAADAPAGTAHYEPPSWDLQIRGPTHLDPPDLRQPGEGISHGERGACAPFSQQGAGHPSHCPPCIASASLHLALAATHAHRLHPLRQGCMTPPFLGPVAPPTEFEGCAAPLVFWVPFFSVFGDTYLGAVMALDAMQREGAFDRWVP